MTTETAPATASQTMTQTKTSRATKYIVRGTPQWWPWSRGGPEAIQTECHVLGAGQQTSGRRQAFVTVQIARDPRPNTPESERWLLLLSYDPGHSLRPARIKSLHPDRSSAKTAVTGALQQIVSEIERMTADRPMPGCSKPSNPSIATHVDWCSSAGRS